MSLASRINDLVAAIRDKLNTKQLGLDGSIVSLWSPMGVSNSISTLAGPSLTTAGVSTAAPTSASNLYGAMRKIEYLLATASTSNAAGYHVGGSNWFRAAPGDNLGGFRLVTYFSVATGAATPTLRGFNGLSSSSSGVADVEPSTLTNMLGVGFDAADTTWQFMRNGGGATADKVNTGIPKPSLDRTHVYKLTLQNKPGSSMVRWVLEELVSGVKAEGTSDLGTIGPSHTTMLRPRAYFSVGGTSNVVGFTLMQVYIEAYY